MHSFPEIVERFERFLKEQRLFEREPNGLYEPCRYLLKAGGKRIRPALCLMGHELFSPWTEASFHAATALELLHNFTLIHDDIMDKAPLRRGLPTVHHKFGLEAGILSGDLMNIYAYDELIRLPDTQLPGVLQLFNRTAIEVCEGQQLDSDFEKMDKVGVAQYLKMIELKTSVLIAAALKIGGLVGNAPKSAQDALYDFGKHIGMAFQLQDDYLDIFGEQNLLGKRRGGDILAAKKTAFYVVYLEKSETARQEELMALYRTQPADIVETVVKMYQDAGVDKAVLKMVEQHTNLAFERLNNLEVTPEKTVPLRQLFTKLLHRKS